MALVSRTVRSRGFRSCVLLLASLFFPLAGVAWLAGEAGPLGEIRERAGLSMVPVFMVVAGLAVGLALLPSHASSLAAGFLFGWGGGAVAALGVVGVAVGIHLTVSRWWAGDAWREAIDRTRWGRILASGLVDVRGWRAVGAVALARLAPQIPFAAGSVLAVGCRVRPVPLVVGTLLGMAPRVLLVVWLGAELAGWSPGEEVPGGFWWALGGAVAGLGGLGWWSGVILRRAGTETQNMG